MISNIPTNTRKYPRVKKIPENTRSSISTLLPDPNPTRYPVFFPILDPILKNPTRWALPMISAYIYCFEFSQALLRCWEPSDLHISPHILFLHVLGSSKMEL